MAGVKKHAERVYGNYVRNKYQTEIKILIVDRPPATRYNVWATMKNKIQCLQTTGWF